MKIICQLIQNENSDPSQDINSYKRKFISCCLVSVSIVTVSIFSQLCGLDGFKGLEPGNIPGFGEVECRSYEWVF